MVLVTTMVLGTAGKVLLPWEILECNSENSTIKEFFCNQVLPRVHGSDIDTTQIEVKNTALLFVYIYLPCINIHTDSRFQDVFGHPTTSEEHRPSDI